MQRPDRDRLLEVLLMGMAVADKAILARLSLGDFSPDLADVLARVRNPHSAGSLSLIERWLELNCGLTLSKGKKLVDCAIEQLRKNADMRDFKAKHGSRDAVLAKYVLLKEERERRAEAERVRQARDAGGVSGAPPTVPIQHDSQQTAGDQAAAG